MNLINKIKSKQLTKTISIEVVPAKEFLKEYVDIYSVHIAIDTSQKFLLEFWFGAYSETATDSNFKHYTKYLYETKLTTEQGLDLINCDLMDFAIEIIYNKVADCEENIQNFICKNVKALDFFQKHSLYKDSNGKIYFISNLEKKL
jgi:hypothetical protein